MIRVKGLPAANALFAPLVLIVSRPVVSAP
jgi:hypothetical protein